MACLQIPATTRRVLSFSSASPAPNSWLFQALMQDRNPVTVHAGTDQLTAGPNATAEAALTSLQEPSLADDAQTAPQTFAWPCERWVHGSNLLEVTIGQAFRSSIASCMPSWTMATILPVVGIVGEHGLLCPLSVCCLSAFNASYRWRHADACGGWRQLCACAHEKQPSPDTPPSQDCHPPHARTLPPQNCKGT